MLVAPVDLDWKKPVVKTDRHPSIAVLFVHSDYCIYITTDLATSRLVFPFLT